jgi:hypothetical protein
MSAEIWETVFELNKKRALMAHLVEENIPLAIREARGSSDQYACSLARGAI